MDKRLTEAWALLWTQGGSYLPAALDEAIRKNIIPDPVGPIVLFKEESIGYVSIRFEGMEPGGLSSLSGDGITMDEGTGTIQLTCTIQDLRLSGHYTVDSGAVAGCSIVSAKNMARSLLTGDGEDPNITMANQYLAQLSQTSNPNGNVLVNMFYDQNETLNSIVLAQNAVVNNQTNPMNGRFRSAWLTYQTNNQNTSYYMGITATAAGNPSQATEGFNDENYTAHGGYMETVLTREALSLQSLNDPRGTSLYNAIVLNAVSNAQSLDEQASSFTGNSVGTLMQYVQSGGSGGGSTDAVPDDVLAARKAIWEKAREQAMKDCDQWVAENRHLEYAPGATRFSTISESKQFEGEFIQSFGGASLVLTGKLMQGNELPEILITEIEVVLPQAMLELALREDHPLHARVRGAVSQALFISRLTRSRVQTSMGSEWMQQYFSVRFNEAIRVIGKKD